MIKNLVPCPECCKYVEFETLCRITEDTDQVYNELICEDCSKLKGRDQG